jgi:hypothetical protein
LLFVVSGFVMVLSSEKLIGQPHASTIFFARRLARIVPLYRVVTTVYLITLMFIRGSRFKDDLSPSSVVGSYLFWPSPRPSGDLIPAIAQAWTLNFEMLFYAAFATGLTFGRIGSVLISSAILIGFDCAFLFNAPRPILCEPNSDRIHLRHGNLSRLEEWGAVACIVSWDPDHGRRRHPLSPGIDNAGWVTFGREWEWGIGPPNDCRPRSLSVERVPLQGGP